MQFEQLESLKRRSDGHHSDGQKERQHDQQSRECGGKLGARRDDNPEALAQRLADYHAKTAPVIALFERKEFVVTIDATQSKDDVYADICDRLGLRRQE